MKNILAISAFLVAANAYACPNFTGEWVCKDSQGEQWVESVVTTGNKYVVTSNPGTPDEKKEELVVDGKVQKETEGDESFAHLALEKAVGMLPKEKQATFIAASKSIMAKTSEFFQSETVHQCKGNSIVSTSKYSGKFAVPLIFSATVSGDGVGTNSIEGNRRVGVIKINGTLVGKPSSLSLFDKIPEKNEQWTETITMECVKK